MYETVFVELRDINDRQGIFVKISILGSGSWGTALAVLLAENGNDVVLWSRSPKKRAYLEKHRENPQYLPGVIIPPLVGHTDDPRSCADADIIVCAIPSVAVRTVVKPLAPYVKDGQKVLSVSKGLDYENLTTLTSVIRDELPNCDVSAMSGPSHAEEVARGMPTANVVASATQSTAEYIQNAFMNSYFRVYTNPDLIGVELGGALKNVIALCAGISDGLGFGDNTKAALLTRGIYEITRLGVAMGAKAETFGGLSGIGDLIVTCTSGHSRNLRAGRLLGQGKTVDQAREEVRMVIEGINTCRAAKALADKMSIEMPIVNQAHAILYEGKSAKDATLSLMGRDKRNESEAGFLRTDS
jgi:glycerol-3-phosphate dehydrogenase (NAD(P)+)